MIYALILLLMLAVAAPVALALLRPRAARGRAEADVALYRDQMAELEAERTAGRLDEAGHAAATLEVQRRLLASPGAESAAPPGALSPRVLAPLLAVPVVALALYLAVGTPDMPSAPWSERRAVQERDDALLAQLRARIAELPPTSDQARQGWLLLANAERGRGQLPAAAEAYGRALAIRFEADAAAQLAQLLLEADRTEEAAAFLARARPLAPEHIGLRFLAGLAALRNGQPAEARALWQALVAEAPEDAPWRGMVQRRLSELP
jgi:cytochrome c-type biogenesis protein CcmH